MSINAAQDKSRSVGTGIILGTAGMGAYFLPVTKKTDLYVMLFLFKKN